jgi:hypothetical protein
VPTFCRHNRFIENCPICSPKAKANPAASKGGGARGTRTARSAAARPPRAAGGLRVRHEARAVADAYSHDLVPGLRSSVDARRLAEEIAFAATRLEVLATDPPGLYAEVALAEREEAAWLAFLIAYLSPLEDDEPFAAVERVRVPWATGEVPALEDVPLGPRTSHDATRGDATLRSYRAWAGRAGSQHAALTGDPDWSPQRRFDRVFERLALPGLRRAARYEFLLLCGRLGIVGVEPSSLQLGREADATVVAAKRVFGIGDAINLHRRAADLASAVEVPIAALDLALVNWSRPPRAPATDGADRITGGVRGVEADDVLQEHVAGVLRVSAQE